MSSSSLKQRAQQNSHGLTIIPFLTKKPSEFEVSLIITATQIFFISSLVAKLKNGEFQL
jgi:hypothetical protein